MSKGRPTTYELRKQGGTTGVGGAGCRLVGEVGEIGAGDARGQVGGSAAGTLGSAKKNAENSAFFFRKFCKVNIFAYICIEKNTKPIQL